MRSHITDFLALLVAVAGIGLVTPLFVSPLSAEGEITITDLGSLTNDSYGESMAWDINPLGLMIVGGSKTDLGLRHAVLWERSESVWAIQDLGPTSGTSVYALGINEHGQVVGDLDSHAALWEEDVSGWTVQYLPIPSSVEKVKLSNAWDINVLGQIVGHYLDDSYDMHAALWEKADGVWVLRDLGKYYDAIGINDSGQIVGSCDTSDGKYAILWERSESGWAVQILPSLGGLYSMANDINALGQIVGWSFTETWERHAVLWEKSGTEWVVQKLPTLGGEFSWGAEGINDVGQIVGTSSTASVDERAALWEKVDGEWVAKDLGTLGGNSGASAINTLGQIVGSSYTLSGNHQHATLWKVISANAGPDQSVEVPHDGDPATNTVSVILDGSALSDPDGDILTYLWSWDGVTATGNSPSLDLMVGEYIITLIVKDPDGAFDTDEVTVTVSEPNQLPIADAGPDQNVTATGGTATVALDGSASSDPDGDILIYSWVEDETVIATVEKPSVSLSVGIHNITLTVTDPYGSTSTDVVTVTVSWLSITDVTLMPRKNKAIAVTIVITNPGATTAYDVTVTAAKLDGSDTNSRLPLVYGAIKPGASKQCTLQFKSVDTTDLTLEIQGTCSLGGFFMKQTETMQ